MCLHGARAVGKDSSKKKKKSTQGQGQGQSSRDQALDVWLALPLADLQDACLAAGLSNTGTAQTMAESLVDYHQDLSSHSSLASDLANNRFSPYSLAPHRPPWPRLSPRALLGPSSSTRLKQTRLTA